MADGQVVACRQRVDVRRGKPLVLVGGRRCRHRCPSAPGHLIKPLSSAPTPSSPCSGSRAGHHSFSKVPSMQIHRHASHSLAVPGGGMDARRTRALIRDEGRLRAALAEHEKRRFDIDTALTVRYRVEDLLETVGLIVQDEDFWVRLTDVNRPPSSQQLERVRQLDPLAFAALLEAAGYASPPPPPVEELVDDTIRALIVAVTSFTGGRADQVGGASWQLQTLVMRVRRQISEQQTPELTPSILRSSARSLGRVVRWLIPRVVAATAGGVVEAYAPGSGLGLLAWRSVERTAEDLGELVTEMV